jgi:hypothetical protein
MKVALSDAIRRVQHYPYIDGTLDMFVSALMVVSGLLVFAGYLRQNSRPAADNGE